MPSDKLYFGYESVLMEGLALCGRGVIICGLGLNLKENIYEGV